MIAIAEAFHVPRGVHSTDDFKVGAPVWVKRRGQPLSQGRIAYLGPVHFAEGEDWVGVELIGAGAAHGKNNGTIDGRTYFETSGLHSGIFVKKSQLSLRKTSKTVSPTTLRCQSPTNTKTNKSYSKSPAIFRNMNSNKETPEQRQRRESLKQWKLKQSGQNNNHRSNEREPRKSMFRRPPASAPARKTHPLLGLSISFSSTAESAATEDINKFIDYSEPFSYDTCENGEEEEIEFDDRTGTSTIETIETAIERRIREVGGGSKPANNNSNNNKRPLFASDENVAPSLPQKTSWEVEEELRKQRLEALEKWKRDRRQKRQSSDNAGSPEPNQRKQHPIRRSLQVPPRDKPPAAHRRTQSCNEVTPPPVSNSKPNNPVPAPPASAEKRNAGKLQTKQSKFLLQEPETPETAPLSMLEMDDNEETIELFAANEQTERESLALGTEVHSLWRKNGKDNGASDIPPAASAEEDSDSHQSERLEVLRGNLAQAQEVYNRSMGCSNVELQQDLDAILESDPKGNNKPKKKETSKWSQKINANSKSVVTQRSCLYALFLVFGIFFSMLVYLSIIDPPSSQNEKDHGKQDVGGKRVHEEKKTEQERAPQPAGLSSQERASFERTTSKHHKHRNSLECFVHCSTCTCTSMHVSNRNS